jgi:uncharacterized membrane protein YheB (UPF0754 family)
LSKTIAGAVVGYITNDLAIQMLFRKRLGLGGIFLKTRAEFIENISHIVERDIINHHTLEDELKNKSFDEILENTVRHYFENKLFEAAGDTLKLADIPEIKTSVENLLATFGSSFDEALMPFFGQITNEMTVSDLLSEAQTDAVGNILANMFVEKSIKSKAVSKIITDIRESRAEMPTESLIVPPLWQQVSHNITQKLHAEIPQILLSEDTQNALDILFYTTEMPLVSRKIAKSIAEKRITDIIGENYSLELQKEILLRLKTVLTSKEGETVFRAFASVLITSLENEEKTLFDLLNEDLGAKIRLFFRDTFPQIFAKIVEWLQARRGKIEELVDATFAQSLDSKFKSWLVETFIGSVSRSVDLVGKVTEILESYAKNPERIAKNISEEITNFLSKQSIGSIVRLLKSEKGIENLAAVLQKNIVAAVTDIPSQRQFFDKKIGDYFPEDKIAVFIEKNLYRIISVELPAQLQSDKRSLLLLTGMINNQLDGLLAKNIEKILTKEQTANLALRAEEYSAKLLAENASNIAPFLARLIKEQVADKKWSGYLSSAQLHNFTEKAALAAQNFGIKEFDKMSEKQLQAYLRLVNRLPDLHARLAVALKAVLMKNLPVLMKGRIEDVVRTNLNHQSPDTIRNMVEKFMGKELKPITMLGGLWGGFAGLMLPFVPKGSNFFVHTGVSALAYGFTGMGTNWIALRMIFRPYYRKKILGLTLPFTPGVAVKNQSRFAKNMGDFVGNKLLNKDGLRLSLDKNKEKLTSLLEDIFVKNDFEQIEKFTGEHKMQLSEKIAWWLLDFARENRQLLEGYILKFAENYRKRTLEEVETEAFEQKIYKFLTDEKSFLKLENRLSAALNNFLKEDFTLAEKVPDSLKNQFVTLIASFALNKSDEYVKGLDGKNLIETLNPLIEQNFRTFSEKNIIQLLGEEQSDKAQRAFSKFIFTQLQNAENQRRIFEIVETKISEEIAPEKKIGELFGGKLLGLVTDNFDFLIQKILQSALDWLRTNADNLAEQVYEEAFKEQKTVFIYKENIKKTVRDLAQNGIPVFIGGEKESLSELVKKEIMQLGEVNLGQIGVDVRKNDLREMIVNLLKSNRLLTAIDELSKNLMASFFTLPLRHVLYVAGAENSKSALSLFEQEMQILLRHATELLKNNKEDIAGSVENLVETVGLHLLRKTKLSEMTAETTPEDWQKAVRKMLDTLKNSEAFEFQVKKLIAEIFAELKRKPLDEIVNWQIFEENISEILRRIFASDTLRESLEESLMRLTEKNLAQANRNINAETKIFVVRLIVAAATATLSEKLPSVLESLDIQKVVVREIEKMPPNEIEELFNSFAKKYFDELVNYGFGFGIIFGIIADVLLSAGWQLFSQD